MILFGVRNRSSRKVSSSYRQNAGSETSTSIRAVDWYIHSINRSSHSTRWRHQMETFSPVPGEFTAQRLVTRSFDVFFDLRLNKRLGKQPPGWWFETPTYSLWRQCNDFEKIRFMSRRCLCVMWHIDVVKPASDSSLVQLWPWRLVKYLFLCSVWLQAKVQITCID